MKDKPTPPETETPLKLDVRRLTRMVRRLPEVGARRLDDAICNIIDLGGKALGVLLWRLPRFAPKIQRRVAMKVEDFLFFHPTKGRRVFKRLVACVKKAGPDCRPYLLAAVADVISRLKNPPLDLATLEYEAVAVLESDTDLLRKGKAVEILALSNNPLHIPAIIHVLANSLDGVENYANYQFVETSLFALKRLGGESMLRLLINPGSSEARQLLRLEWRHHPEEHAINIVKLVQGLDEQVGPLLLKVIELSEYNLPFIAMIREGLEHPDKWVRQSATASMKKVGDDAGFEHLDRMLRDPAVEVRLMAISSLGSYAADTTGEALTRIALSESETPEIRLNALYALFSQKNAAAFETLRQCPTPIVSANAIGLHSLLMPREEGLKQLLEEIGNHQPASRQELFHYLYELSWPEDLSRLLQFHGALPGEDRKAEFLEFLISYLRKNAGPKLDAAVERLGVAEQKAVRLLIVGSLGDEVVPSGKPS